MELIGTLNSVLRRRHLHGVVQGKCPVEGTPTTHVSSLPLNNRFPQIEKAFAPGYDPALELAKHSARKPAPAQPLVVEEDGLEWDLDGPWTQHLRRAEQDLIDRIVHGNEVGHYFVLLGPKVCE